MQARNALVRYFASRHGLADAEDLAHATIAAVLQRPDFEFTSEADFCRVCLGFARLVSRGERRKQAERPPFVDSEIALASYAGESHAVAETRVLLEEVYRHGPALLKEEEWQMIRSAAESDDGPRHTAAQAVEANRHRVTLHRLRQKLKKLTGVPVVPRKKGGVR